MEIEVLLDLIELILSQRGEVGDFVEDIIKKNFVLDGGTLFIATKMGQIEIVRFILKSGVKPTLKSFQYAAEHEFFELCRLFVEFGSRKILSTPELEEELLTNLSDGHLENFKNLINRGTDPTSDYNSAIRLAVENDYLKIVRLLLEHGVDTDEVIVSASGNGQLEIVRLLLKHRANLTVYNNASIQGASFYGHLEIVSLLLEYGADPTANKNYAIKWASTRGHFEVVRLLLNNNSKYKVDPTAGNNYAIKWASKYGYFEIIELLKQYGANL
jgi:ankyrin repeat protein